MYFRPSEEKVIIVKLLQNKSVKLAILFLKIGEFLFFFARQLFLIRLGFQVKNHH